MKELTVKNLPDVFFLPTGQDGFHAYFSEAENKLVTYGRYVKDESDIHEVKILGPCPSPFEDGLWCGEVPIFRYNYHRFEHTIYIEDWFYLWALNKIDVETIIQFIDVVLNRATEVVIQSEQGSLAESFRQAMARNERKEMRIAPSSFYELEDQKGRLLFCGKNDRSSSIQALIKETSRTAIDLYMSLNRGNDDCVEIAICGNEAMFPHMPTVMFSVLDKTPGRIQFHIVHSDPIETSHRAVFTELMRMYPESGINFVPLDPARLESFFKSTRHEFGWNYISKDTYSRALLPSLLNIPRVLYLDVDVVVAHNLRPLWEWDLKDKMMGMVQEPDFNYCFNRSEAASSFYRPVLWQAGVILMNLDKMRDAKFEDRIRARNDQVVAETGKVDYMDQQLINLEFGDKVQRLPMAYNFATCLLSPTISTDLDMEDDVVLETLLGTLFREIVIFHSAGKIKGWDREHSRYFRTKEKMKYSLERFYGRFYPS